MLNFFEKPDKMSAASPEELQAFYVTALERRVLALERHVTEIVNLMTIYILNNNEDKQLLHDDFKRLVAYVSRPNKQIMGDGGEPN